MKIGILKITSIISFLLFSILGLLIKPQELHNINLIIIAIVLIILVHSFVNNSREKNKKIDFKIFKYGLLSLTFSLFGIVTKYGYNRVYTSPFTLEIDKSDYLENTKNNLFPVENKINENESKKPFKIELNKISLGNNVGRIISYNIKKGDTMSLLTIIVNNEYEKGKVSVDSFSDGTLSPSFEFYINSFEKNKLKIQVLEEFVYTKNDSTVIIDRISNYMTVPLNIE